MVIPSHNSAADSPAEPGPLSLRHHGCRDRAQQFGIRWPHRVDVKRQVHSGTGSLEPLACGCEFSAHRDWDSLTRPVRAGIRHRRAGKPRRERREPQ